MARETFTFDTTYDTYSGDEQTGEFEVTLSYRITPAEPDVGIFHSGIEPIGVKVNNAASWAWPEQVSDLETTILEDEAFWSRLEPSLFQEADATAADEAEYRAEARAEARAEGRDYVEDD